MEMLSFTQKLLLSVAPIVVTAVLAGLIVPLILRVIDSRKTESMKRFEAALVRQTKIIDAQAELLDELTKALWNWRYLFMRVTYTGAEQTDEALNTAWKQYDEKSWDSLYTIRVQITRARRLISQHAYEVLQAQYDQIIEVDRRLGAGMKLSAEVRRRDLEELNLVVFGKLSSAIDSSLQMVAEEMHLVSSATLSKD